MTLVGSRPDLLQTFLMPFLHQRTVARDNDELASRQWDADLVSRHAWRHFESVVRKPCFSHCSDFHIPEAGLVRGD
jgi:hypothetical protein